MERKRKEKVVNEVGIMLKVDEEEEEKEGGGCEKQGGMVAVVGEEKEAEADGG